MKKANRSSKIINFKDFNTGYNAVSEREDNIIGKKIADFRAANKMSLTDLRILLEIYGISITNASISKWETGASVPNIYQFIAVMQALGIDENISFPPTPKSRRRVLKNGVHRAQSGTPLFPRRKLPSGPGHHKADNSR